MRTGRPPGSTRPAWPRPAGLASALLLHAAAVWLLLPHGASRPGIPLADPPTIEIEMVDQAEQAQGRPPTTQNPPAPEQPPPPAPLPATDGPAAGQPPAQASQPATPSQPPPQATPQATPQPQPRAPAPTINLGNADDDQDPLRVTGDNVVPPRPDATFRNKPPAYPLAAARRRHEGTVLVQARIGTAGVPETVRVGATSGDPDLDRAALEAVQLWRFQPAREAGVPVPFDYEVNIRFSLSDR